jgi:hypothetical protein
MVSVINFAPPYFALVFIKPVRLRLLPTLLDFFFSRPSVSSSGCRTAWNMCAPATRVAYESLFVGSIASS